VQAVRDGRAHDQQFICSVYAQDTLDEKGQARDTRVQRDTLSDAVVSLRTLVTLVTWLISITEFSSLELVL